MTYGSDEGLYQTYDPNFDFSEVMKRLYQVQNRIASTVTRLGEAESSITQNADQIQLKVSKVDYTGAVVTSLITQDAESITLLANSLNLNGLVTFTNLSTPGQTVIDGGNIFGNLLSIGNGVTDSRLELFTSDTDYHYIQSTRYGAGSSDGSSITGGMRIIAPNGPISLAPNGGTGVYITTAPLIAKMGLRVVGTSQFDGYTVVNDTLNATNLMQNGNSVSLVGHDHNTISGYYFNAHYFQFGYYSNIIKELLSGFEFKTSDYGGYLTLYATDFIKASLREWKKNIEPYTENATLKIESTPVRTFNYKEEPDSAMKTVGFIADEVPLEMLDLAGKGVNFSGTIALMFKAIQELSERVKTLEAGAA